MRKRLHYDWHWIWDYGNGDLGNQGIHEMDKARWGLGKKELPKSVVSVGGRFGYIDDGETANTQLCVFDYGDSELIFEVRGLPTDSPYPGGLGGKPGTATSSATSGTARRGSSSARATTAAWFLRPDLQVVKKFNGGGDDSLRELRQGGPQRQARGPELRHRRRPPVRRPVPPGQHQLAARQESRARRIEGNRRQQGSDRGPEADGRPPRRQQGGP